MFLSFVIQSVIKYTVSMHRSDRGREQGKQLNQLKGVPGNVYQSYTLHVWSTKGIRMKTSMKTTTLKQDNSYQLVANIGN